MRTAGIPLGLAAVLATLLGAGVARAQLVGVDTAPTSHHGPETPQNFALEARFGAFYPAVDSEPGLHGTPYKDLFHSSPQLLAGGEFSWQVGRIPHLGTLGPGLGASYMRATGPAPYTAAPHAPSGEQTSLEIIPFYAVAVLRVDVLWRDLGIPVVPWAKLGLGYALWDSKTTLGTSTYQGVVAQGHSVGTHVALGVGLNLNVFDPTAAKEFDNSMGVNSTYLFAEWTREDLGMQGNAMRVGGTEWTFGLAIEF